jgi:hypothetical protein
LDAGQKAAGGVEPLQKLGEILLENAELAQVLLHAELSFELGQELRLSCFRHAGLLEL